MTSSWRTLEDHVRGIASLRWATPCRPEHIDGVDFDAVCRVAPDELVIIEITEEQNLKKVRDDINKIGPTKIRLATQGFICRAYIVLSSQPTDSMVEAGQASHITVCSSADFERAFFDFKSYDQLRSKLSFGSAVDSKTGANDTRAFIPVKYVDTERDKTFTVGSISGLLQQGAHVVLSGDYGTGKSRCVREVYTHLRADIAGSGAFPLAINLRDHWSSSSALEIIAGHLGNVGLGNSVDNVMRLLNSGHLILLLDGFDEIGTQVHDTRIEDRRALRKRAVQGVRDLIQKCRAGVLITGRSHFFDGNSEMIESLGLSQSRDLYCMAAPETFSAAEGTQYLSELGITAALPEWMPRRPLVFQMLVELDKEDIEFLFKRQFGQFEFWAAFIYAVCRRESKGVGDSIAPQTIQLILQYLAAKTRYSQTFTGRLTPSDIDSAYQMVVGSVPDQSGRQLLSRMCTLGRIEPESPDRQFVDPNVLDVLRADALISDIVTMSDASGQVQWKQSLRLLGIAHAAQMIHAYDLGQHSFSYLHKFGTSRNTKRLGEIVSALSLYGEEPLDFRSLTLKHSALPVLHLSHRTISNLTVNESEIEVLFLDGTPITSDQNLLIEDCIISCVSGVSAQTGLPEWIKGSDVVNFDRLSNASRIKESPLSPAQKLFLAIVHKIFFQPGAGREEASLLKGGYGQKYSPKLADSILRLLMKHGVVERFRGDDGWVYKPVRRYTDRMNRLKSELTLSEDALWTEVSSLRV